MKVDYRKDLERAARQMIMIHRPDVLIKLILRTIVRSVKIKHAGVLIYDKSREEYVITVSKGDAGFRIPSGFAKVKGDNPLIRYFTDRKFNFPKEAIIWSKISKLIEFPGVEEETRGFLESLCTNLSFYHTKVCIPGFFRDDLIGILLLGEKLNKKEFSREEIGFLSVLASDVVMAIKNAWLIEDLSRQIEKNKRLFLQTVEALASSIEAKDIYTIGHTRRVMDYALGIARNLRKNRGIKSWEEFLENLKITAQLHDVGKIGVPENILNKPSFLNEEERKKIEMHPLIGENILKHIEEFKDILLGVKHHHERYDGKGYPSSLKGRNIPVIASIISLADAYDAMTTDRSYRRALSREDVIREIKNNRGKQFSPSVVDAFLRMQESGKNIKN